MTKKVLDTNVYIDLFLQMLIMNDCLIASSARTIGAVVYTQNKKDFQSIKDVFDFKVEFI